MTHLREQLTRLGGVASTTQLAMVGIRRADIYNETARGSVIGLRQGWVALPGAPEEVVRAVRLGGRVSCQTKTDAIVTLDSALKQERVSRTELEFLVAGLPAKYRAYLDLADGSAASGPETKARLGLHRYNIPYRTQVKIAGVGSVDLVVGDRLVVEADGREWHTTTEAYLEDRRRDLELTAFGYAVLRLSYLQVMERWDAVIDVIRALVARGEHRWSSRHLKAGLGTGAELM